MPSYDESKSFVVSDALIGMSHVDGARLTIIVAWIDKNSLGSISRVNVAWIAAVWALGVNSIIWILFDLLSNKVISLLADTSVESFNIVWVWRTSGTFSIYSDVSVLAEAAAFVEIFVEAADWSVEGRTRESSAVVDFSVFASVAYFGSVSKDFDKSDLADTGLSLWGILLISSAFDFNANVID